MERECEGAIVWGRESLREHKVEQRKEMTA